MLKIIKYLILFKHLISKIYYMELIIYIILFILIIYINNKSIEHLTTNTKSRSVPLNNTYSSINQYRANYNPYFKSHLNNSTFDNVVPYNNTNPWIIKDSGYSDIFNDEDVGGYQISHILNTPKPVVFLEKTMTKIYNKINKNTMASPKMMVSPEFMALPKTMVSPEFVALPKTMVSPEFVALPKMMVSPEFAALPKRMVSSDKAGIEIKENTDTMILPKNDGKLIKTDETLSFSSNKTSTIIQNDEIKYSDTIIDNNDKYHLLGIAYNNVYKQYYLIYEFRVLQNKDDLILRDNMINMKIQLYNYALVQIENNKEVIKYIFGPREKINSNDIIYFHQGFIKLGPFIINNI